MMVQSESAGGTSQQGYSKVRAESEQARASPGYSQGEDRAKGSILTIEMQSYIHLILAARMGEMALLMQEYSTRSGQRNYGVRALRKRWIRMG